MPKYGVLLRFERRRAELAELAALGRAFLGRALVSAEAGGQSPLFGLLPGRAW